MAHEIIVIVIAYIAFGYAALPPVIRIGESSKQDVRSGAEFINEKISTMLIQYHQSPESLVSYRNMTRVIPADIRAFLEACIERSLDHFRVELHEGNKKGEGYLGDFFFISLTNKENNEALHLAIKQALVSGTETSMNFVSTLFRNESYFYETLWPEFMRFQARYPNVRPFLNISKYYAIDAKKGAEKIALENLRYKGFRNHVKTIFFGRQQLEFVLKIYGEFHAISMAYRELDQENFRNIIDSKINSYAGLCQMPFFKRSIKECCQYILSSFDEKVDEDIMEKFKVYTEKGPEIFNETLKYGGDHQVLIHGDCWSNNIMFKYNEHNDIEDLKLIDFQLIKFGTVVYDLSYCIYASASEEAFDDLDHYLRIYHSSLSQSLRAYNLDPDRVYPYDVLKLEWKRYSKMGLIMALLVNSGKHSEADSIPVITKVIDDEVNDEMTNDNTPESLMQNPEKFLKIGRSIVVHGIRNGYL